MIWEKGKKHKNVCSFCGGSRKLLLAAVILSTGLSGCSVPFLSTPYVPIERENIQLVEPVVFEKAPEKVMYRDLYNASCCTCSVIPYTQEYAFVQNVKSFTYKAMPGTHVEVGDVLVKPNDTTLDSEIEKITETLENAAKEIEELTEKAKTDTSGKISNELSMKQELYDLDSEHLQKQLDSLIKTRDANIITAKISGTISGIFDSTGSVKAGAAVVSLSDETQKLIRTDFYKVSDLKNAEDYYALIDGVRFEVEQMESTVKNQSLFRIIDDENKVSVGDRCLFIVLMQHVDSALSITTELIKTDSAGSYVYIKNGSALEKRYLTLGMSDGFFTEIKDGLSLGDCIADSEEELASGKTGVVGKMDVTTEYSGNGFFFYPSTKDITMPIKNGTVYLKKFTAGMYSYVQEGDVIAEVYVVGDDLELERLMLQLKRLQERNASETQINALSEKIDSLVKDYETTQIKADKAGIIVGFAELNADDVIQKGEMIARVADDTNCYVAVQNAKALTYGKKVTITYVGLNKKPKEAVGKVVSLGDTSTATTLKTDFLLIQVAEEDVLSIMQAQGGGRSRASITVNASIPEYTGVLTVPKAAVSVYNGLFYTNVLEPDGTVKKVCFISCGSDKNVYYCIAGLREGETVCLK